MVPIVAMTAQYDQCCDRISLTSYSWDLWSCPPLREYSFPSSRWWRGCQGCQPCTAAWWCPLRWWLSSWIATEIWDFSWLSFPCPDGYRRARCWRCRSRNCPHSTPRRYSNHWDSPPAQHSADLNQRINKLLIRLNIKMTSYVSLVTLDLKIL